MTPQDIREKTFEKAMFGGYDMAAVQNYQEEVATELANAQKEVAVLKGKMKVLVDKAVGLGKKGGVGRTYADAPEIDGVVHIQPPEKASKTYKTGDLISVRILGVQGHDLVGIPV